MHGLCVPTDAYGWEQKYLKTYIPPWLVQIGGLKAFLIEPLYVYSSQSAQAISIVIPSIKLSAK